jgi:putative sigma-54 modulation protein
MEIKIYARNTHLSDRIAEYAHKKLEKLERYMPSITDVQLELRQEKHNNKEQPIAQLTVRNKRGAILRVEDRKQSDLHAAVDVVVDKMSRQISRYKDKSRRRGGAAWEESRLDWETAEAVPVSDMLDYDEVKEAKVVRRKEILLTPMSEQEAIDQMELLEHDFFVFYNGEEDAINVLYRRKDNDYGVLTPRID